MGLVLACMTDSPTAWRVAQAAALVGAALGVETRYVHFGEAGSAGAKRVAEAVAAARGESADASGLLDVRPRIEGVAPDKAIRACIAELGATMVVLGAVPRERTWRDLFGSVARRVAWRAGCSVLLVATRGREPRDWSRFLVGVEARAEAGSSGPSAAPGARSLASDVLAIARTCAGARSGEASVCLVHEQREPTRGLLGEPGRADGSNARLSGLAAERHMLGEFALGLDAPAGVKLEAVTLPGRPGQELARHAEDTSADLVGVLAPARPLGWLSRLLSHPVHLVLDQLPCAVLLHREGAGERASAEHVA